MGSTCVRRTNPCALTDEQPCGEGGEYESFTLDCPLFKERIVMYACLPIRSNNEMRCNPSLSDETEVIEHSRDARYLLSHP